MVPAVGPTKSKTVISAISMGLAHQNPRTTVKIYNQRASKIFSSFLLAELCRVLSFFKGKFVTHSWCQTACFSA